MQRRGRSHETRAVARIFIFDALVTGPKRRIALVDEVQARAGDEATVLDVRAPLERPRGAAEFLDYFAEARAVASD
jgi:hypothetical protein